MSLIDCENVQVATMAQQDGEQPAISPEQIALHLSACENCRKQTQELRGLDEMLARQLRQAQDADLWPIIQDQISVLREAPAGWQPFIVVGLLLAMYKILEAFVEQGPPLILNLVPLILTIGLFVLIKENPFRINSELMWEKKS